jgi:hypothetical protein
MPTEYQVAKSLRRLNVEDKLRATMNEFGCPVGMDLLDWMVLIGRGYIVYAGTENAPIDTSPVDDIAVNMLLDIPEGVTAMLAEASTHIVDMTTGTAPEAMIEVDNGKIRYSSAGTAFTPLNLNTGKPNASGCNAYVGPDVVATAKTGSGSLEIARFTMGNDALATQVGSENYNFLWTAKKNIIVIVEGPGSIILHFGSETADVTGYSQMKFIVL